MENIKGGIKIILDKTNSDLSKNHNENMEMVVNLLVGNWSGGGDKNIGVCGDDLVSWVGWSFPDHFTCLSPRTFSHFSQTAISITVKGK